jgi:hypothetical protein
VQNFAKIGKIKIKVKREYAFFFAFLVKDLAKFREIKHKNLCHICTLFSLVAVFEPVLLFFRQVLETYCHLIKSLLGG